MKRGSKMEVNGELSKEFSPPHVTIYADVITDEVQRVIDLLDSKDTPLIVQRENRMIVLKAEEIYMIRVEGGDTVIYTENDRYYSRRRLYEILNQNGTGFIQISKQTVINFSCIKSIETGFGGTLLLKLKNDCSDYVSRKYLPDLKRYLGI